MSYQKHCPGCFRRKDANPVCPHCGYDESTSRSPLFLPHGVVLAGQYRVGKILGKPGGFGITYLGWDIYLQQKVAIKEYLPPDIAARIPESQDITVHTQDDRKDFDVGKEQFVREARIVARLDHPNIVRVRSFFNANDTAYMVMDYYDGMSLDAYFHQVKQTLDPTTAASLAQLILDGLAYVHTNGVVHRDVKPHNIYLAAVGKPILLDFGAARKAEGKQQSISVVLTEGYAPLEQYQRHGGQGPWTDVYGVAATLYRMIVGRAPPVALDRLHRDELETSNFEGIPEALKPVLRIALAQKAEDRYQNAIDFKNALAGAIGAATTPVPLPIITASVGTMATEPAAATPLVNVQLLPDTTRRVRIDAATGPYSGPVTVPAIVSMPAPVAPAAAPFSTLSVGSEASYRTHSPTVPRTFGTRWLFPATAILVGAAALLLTRQPSGGEAAQRPTTAVVTTASAPVAPVDAQAALEQFQLSGLPPLPTGAIPTMAEIPAGQFNGNALPAFRISDTEITVGKFRSFAERTHYVNPAWDNYPCDGTALSEARWDNPGYTQTESHPVVCVNWDDARRYAAWLSQETGRKFRLPTDGEWQYAAAAGNTGKYWWGSQVDGNYAVCSDCGRQNPAKPWIVASLGRNAWGLYGTASNVREWSCTSSQDSQSPTCADRNSSGNMVTRGGSWRDPATALRTDFRDNLDKARRNAWTGFRVVEVLH